MIRILIQHGDQVREIDLPELFKLRASSDFQDTMVWVDMDNPTEEEEETVLIHLFLFHPLSVEDCQRERLEPDEGDHYPKVEEYGDYLFVIFNPLDMPIESYSYNPNAAAEEYEKLFKVKFPTRQINTFLGKNFLITHHYERSPSVEYARTMCLKNPQALRRGPDYVFHVIIDQIVDNYAPVMDYFDDLVERTEFEVFENSQSSLLSRILSLKKGIQRLKRITTYQREILNRLSRGEFTLIASDEAFYYRNVYDHLVRIVDLTETYRDLVNGLLDAYLSVSNNRMGEVMKVLTVISTIFLPLTLITGIYGMNFDHMPELHTEIGYYAVWTLMITVAGGMLLFFKKKGWLD